LLYIHNKTLLGNEASCTGETIPKIRNSGNKQMVSIGHKNEILKKFSCVA
jgi:hypothetical protein